MVTNLPQRCSRCYCLGEKCEAVPALAKEAAKELVAVWSAVPADERKKESAKAYLKNLRSAFGTL